jgi:hypothetical protein
MEVRIDLRFGRRDFAYKVTLSECERNEMDMANKRTELYSLAISSGMTAKMMSIT